MQVGKQPASLQSCLGYDRVHVLAAFTNALFLAFVSFFLLAESLRRIVDAVAAPATPHKHHADHDDHVIAVAMAGLAVNVAGLWLLAVSSRQARAAADASGGGMRRSKSAGLESPLSGGGSAGGLPDSVRHSRMLNLHSVLVHAVADCFNSVGVIAATLLVRRWGWELADPLFAALVTVLVARSISPLLSGSGRILLQGAPPGARASLDAAMREIATLQGVLECDRERIFTYAPHAVVTTLHVRVRDSALESELLPRIYAIIGGFSQHVCVHMQKDQA